MDTSAWQNTQTNRPRISRQKTKSNIMEKCLQRSRRVNRPYTSDLKKVRKKLCIVNRGNKELKVLKL